MDKEIKREALRQYLNYFKVWFIITGIVLVLTIGAVIARVMADNRPRGNAEAPAERVYDYADVLTDSEEAKLRQEIAECEQMGKIDIVIVTLNEPMGESDRVWDDNMMNYADDFYDNGKYGWNRAYGDGALLLDNWYEDSNGSQKGSWLSTSGKMEDTIGVREEDAVLDAMYAYIDDQPYQAYRAAVYKLADYGRYGYDGGYGSVDLTGLCCIWIVPFFVAVVYASVNMMQSKAKDTTTAKTYMGREGVNVRFRSDDFIRKNVTSHRIESSSSGGGGSSHHGGGSHGSHRSSGGHSHGGGGRRR
ncbi:MAG: TPM domain-containing protein [Butyrivibrio sp.]|nr:TPM domain-containing protein [Muribaculum sp.]MCM1553614.1 TPM domain-containing protein [Butyrivibrio sp.]